MITRPFAPRSLEITRTALRAIPAVTLDDILGDERTEIKLTMARYEDGMMPLRDAMALLAILTMEQPKEVLEIGTFMGHTARAMAENLPNSRIHTVDLPREFTNETDGNNGPPKDDIHLIRRRVVGREFRGRQCEDRIVQHFADTAKWDFKEAGQPSFFVIDGSHTYEYCRNDSQKCLAICPQGGTFLWHDCDENHPGVVKLISEWRALMRAIVRIEGTGLAYWKSQDVRSTVAL